MYITQELLTACKRPDVYGACDNAAVFSAITKAILRANNPALFDWSVTQADFCVCDGCVTMPADYQTILTVNQGGWPTVIRSEWFEYSLNGTGTQDCPPCRFTTVQGRFSTIHDPDKPMVVVAEIENSADNQKEVRVFGWDENGKRIYTEGAGGALEDGFLVPTVFGFSPPNPDVPAIGRIDRVKKTLTNGFVRLLAYEPDDTTKRVLLGHYMPWETEPWYQRIKVASKTWLRIKYRKKDLVVRGIGDWINLDNEEALFFFLKAVKYGSKDEYDLSQAAAREGMRLLSEQQNSLRSPAELNQPTIIFHQMPTGGSPGLFY